MKFVKPGAGAELADQLGGGDAAGFEIGRHADAAQLATLGGLGLAGGEAGVVGRFHRRFQGREVVAAVILQGDRGLVGEGVARDEVLEPDGDAVHAEFEGFDDDDIVRRLVGDLVRAGVDVIDTEVRAAMRDKEAEARRSLMGPALG